MHNKSKNKQKKKNNISYHTNATTITKSNKKQLLSNGIINEYFFLFFQSRRVKVKLFSCVTEFLFVYKKMLQTYIDKSLKEQSHIVVCVYMCNVFLGYCCTYFFFFYSKFFFK